MNRKPMQFLIFVFFCMISSISLSQNYIWARAGIGRGTSNYTNFKFYVANDTKGNIYTTGAFTDSIKFGNTVLTSTTPYLADVFISKYDSKGNLKWVIQDGGISDDGPTAICYSGGFIYVTGGFQSTATFGTTTFNENIGISSAFIVKYDTAGNFIWARKISGNYSASTVAYLTSIKGDDNGDLIIGGWKYGSATLMLENIAINDEGAFITKYDNNGNAIWISMGYCNVGIKIYSVIADHAGNYYSTGEIGNFFTTGSGYPAIFGNDTIYCYRYSDIFLVKYNSAGTPLWAKRIGNGWLYDYSRDLGVDSLNNVYLAGSFNDTVASGHSDFMIIKYDSAGNIIWMKNTTNAYCNALDIDKQGNVYFTGGIFGNMILNNDTIIADQNQILTGKLDSNGNTVWIAKADNPANNTGLDICVSHYGNIFITGTFSSITRFGQDLLIGKNYSNLFVTMLNDTSLNFLHNNIIKGNIFNDLNGNCIKDSGENNITGFSVMVQPGNIFGICDINGNYSLKVDSGVYNVSQLLPVSHTINPSQICPVLNGGYVINALSSNIVYNGNDFSDNITECPLLYIWFGDQPHIACNDTILIEILIKNYGLVPANNVQLSVVYSSDFIPISSIPAWTSYIPSDTTLIFDLGTIAPNSDTIVTIKDSVTCLSPFYQWKTYYNFARITPINNCIPSDSIYCLDTLSQHLIGISENTKEIGFNIFPNPAVNKIKIDFYLELGDNTVTIYNLQGQLILQKAISKNKTEIDISSFAKGLYFIKLSTGEGSVVRKFVKE